VIELHGDIGSVHNDRDCLLAIVSQAKLGDAKEAIRSAKIAVKLAESPAYRDTLAAAYAEAGAFEKAIGEPEGQIGHQH
jgi:hypothetical protein